MSERANKVIRAIDRGIDKVTSVVCLILFLICTYALIDTANIYYKANDSGLLKFKPEITSSDGEAPLTLADLENAAAWLTIDNTNIDYPIMQGVDNTVYLNTDPEGNFSLSGSIFLDYRNASDFSDPYSLIYGHHMDAHGMFGDLDYYLGESYFNKNRHGTLTAVDGKVYDISIFAVLQPEADDSTVFDPAGVSADRIESYAKQFSTHYYDDGLSGSRVLALSTCTNSGDMSRTVVLGHLTEIGGKS